MVTASSSKSLKRGQPAPPTESCDDLLAHTEEVQRGRSAIRDTLTDVAQAISVRLDDDAERALRALEAAGMSRSEAIRSALVESARRLRQSSELAAEVAALEADDADREEMSAVAALMESLRAPR